MNKRRFAVLLFGLATWCPQVWAQYRPSIDGSKNPELISDRVAARLFLRSLAYEVDNNRMKILGYKVATVGLSTADSLALGGIAARYAKVQHDTDTTDGAQFTLITDIMGQKMITSDLSIEGQVTFLKFLDQEKRRMRTDPEEEPVTGRGATITLAAYHPGHPAMQGAAMGPHYSTYLQQVTGSEDFEFNTNGYASCSNPPNRNVCATVIHQIHSTLNVGTCSTITNCSGFWGGTANGPQVQPTAYSTSTEAVTIPWDAIWNNTYGDYGQPLFAEDNGEVQCSITGDFWDTSWIPISIEWAWTRVQVQTSPPCANLPGGGIRCYVAYLCDSPSAPPDYIPHTIVTNQYGIVDMPPFWLGGAAGFSIGGSPYIFPGPEIAGSLPGGSWWKFVLAPGIPWNGGSFECTKASAGTGPSIPWPF